MDALSIDSTLMGLALFASSRRGQQFPENAEDLDLGLKPVYEPGSGETISIE
jgi:hypothetical protein